MKLINKILPITALTAIATIPMATTSCSNVWEDMFASQYKVNFEAADAKSVSETEATNIYFDYFSKNENNLIPDCYWGISAYCREELDKSGKWEVRNYLSHIDYFKAKDQTLSFKLHSQIEVKVPGEGTTSYSIETYDLVWEIDNLQFKAYCYGETRPIATYPNIWVMCPVKYSIAEGKWTEELTGDEKIIFEFKTVKKGFGEDGSQNFIREISESAIIDGDHKYVPQLSEIYTNSLLLESFYLSKLSKK